MLDNARLSLTRAQRMTQASAPPEPHSILFAPHPHLDEAGLRQRIRIWRRTGAGSAYRRLRFLLSEEGLAVRKRGGCSRLRL